MPLPWPDSLLPEAAIAGFVTAVAAGTLGGFAGGALARPMRPAAAPAGRTGHRAALAGLLAVVAVIGWGLPISSDGPASAVVRLTDVPSSGGRNVQATIRIRPADALKDANFANVTAWQGGGSVVSDLEEIGPGRYRTTKPIPVHGGWKATLRLQQGSSLVAVPVFQPEDRGIPAPETPASARFTREFRPDIVVLQRERKQDVPGALSAAAYLSVLAIALVLSVLLAWSLLRIDAGGPRPRREGRTATTRAELV
jgi:hypothetical protein